jgi:broad-specificity NMP kinase
MDKQESLMVRVLITGMSGTGKSSVIGELRKRGFQAIDMDEPDWSEFVDGNQLWCEERLQQALDDTGDAPLFISGCAENQVKFYPQLTDLILLSAPAAVIEERLLTRTSNSYGKRPEEMAEALGYVEAVEPLLRRGATLEIVTTIPLEAVVEQLLEHVMV